MHSSLFNTYERGHQQPVHFKWKQRNEILNIPRNEHLHAGELIMVDQFRGIQKKAYYVLTKKV
jgi:hypothetical protein